ncbi:MAG: hypothetical protein HY292_16975 [Planctomycetes bacterium]|nr:hypothetical protein [Planctomycetota bacterium]
MKIPASIAWGLVRFLIVGCLCFAAWNEYSYLYERVLVHTLFPLLPHLESPNTTVSGKARRRERDILVQYWENDAADSTSSFRIVYREFDFGWIILASLLAAHPGIRTFRRPVRLVCACAILFVFHVAHLYLGIQYAYQSFDLSRLARGAFGRGVISTLYRFNREIGVLVVPLALWAALVLRLRPHK